MRVLKGEGKFNLERVKKEFGEYVENEKHLIDAFETALNDKWWNTPRRKMMFVREILYERGYDIPYRNNYIEEEKDD